MKNKLAFTTEPGCKTTQSNTLSMSYYAIGHRGFCPVGPTAIQSKETCRGLH